MTTPAIYIGIDPDTKNTGLAAVQTGPAGPRVVAVEVASAPAKLPVADRVIRLSAEIPVAVGCLLNHMPGELDVLGTAVEGQQTYHDRVDAQDLIHLAQVAGICLGSLPYLPARAVWIPRPAYWKGQVPKKVHQSRILQRVVLTAELEGVPGSAKMTKTQKGHVIDAIGLALWAAERRALDDRRDAKRAA